MVENHGGKRRRREDMELLARAPNGAAPREISRSW